LLAGWSIDIHIKTKERDGDRMARADRCLKKNEEKGMYVLFLDLGRLIRPVLQLDHAREVSGDCVAYAE
jgi:hypothetical protein